MEMKIGLPQMTQIFADEVGGLEKWKGKNGLPRMTLIFADEKLTGVM